MSDEDAFQAALDANPADHVTRLVFADWLQDRDDPRADGYRALARLGRQPQYAWTLRGSPPCIVGMFFVWSWVPVEEWFVSRVSRKLPSSFLPFEWHQRTKTDSIIRPNEWDTVHEAEDAAAAAFIHLQPELRAKLLAFAAV